MAVPYPPEWADEELMAKSVMDEPRSLLQKAGDFVFGRTPSEKFTNAFTSLPMARYEILDKDLIKPFYRGLDLLPKRLADWLQNTKNNYQYVIDRSTSPRNPAGSFNGMDLITIYPNSRAVQSGDRELHHVLNHETTHALVNDVGKYGVKPPGIDMDPEIYKDLLRVLYTPGTHPDALHEIAVNEFLPMHLGGNKWPLKIDYPTLQNTYQSWWPR